jgi:hypothetical protein
MPGAFQPSVDQLHIATGGTGPAPNFVMTREDGSIQPSLKGTVWQPFTDAFGRDMLATPGMQEALASARKTTAERKATALKPVAATQAQPTAANQTGSSDYKHGGTTPKKKKEEQGRGSARSALLLSGGGGKLG